MITNPNGKQGRVIVYGPKRLSPAQEDQFDARINKCMREYPHKAEGVIYFDDIEYWCVYADDDDFEFIVVYLGPRDMAEKILNELGMTTDERFAPLANSSQVKK
jgi:hypothetical protein